MYTGLVGKLGSIRKIEAVAEGLRIDFEAAHFVKTLAKGDLVLHSGFSLPVFNVREGLDYSMRWSALATAPFAKAHIAAAWRHGQLVNLERPTEFSDELGGNFVFGEPSRTLIAGESTTAEDRRMVRFTAEEPLTDCLGLNGAMAVDGIALTCHKLIDDRTIDVVLSGLTLRCTTLATLTPGQRLAMEADLLHSTRIAPAWPGG
ncbi:MAG: riboflavin synthase [Rhodospirillales bacterium]